MEKKWSMSANMGGRESPSGAKVGEELGPVEYKITGANIQECANIFDDYNPWFFKESPFGGPIAHPLIGATDCFQVLNTKYSTYGLVYTKAAREFINPIRPGKSYTVKGKIVDRYTRRGRDYLVIETVTTDEDGLEVVRSRDTSLLSMERREQE